MLVWISLVVLRYRRYSVSRPELEASPAPDYDEIREEIESEYQQAKVTWQQEFETTEQQIEVNLYGITKADMVEYWSVMRQMESIGKDVDDYASDSSNYSIPCSADVTVQRNFHGVVIAKWKDRGDCMCVSCFLDAESGMVERLKKYRDRVESNVTPLGLKELCGHADSFMFQGSPHEKLKAIETKEE